MKHDRFASEALGRELKAINEEVSEVRYYRTEMAVERTVSLLTFKMKRGGLEFHDWKYIEDQFDAEETSTQINSAVTQAMRVAKGEDDYLYKVRYQACAKWLFENGHAALDFTMMDSITRRVRERTKNTAEAMIYILEADLDKEKKELKQ